VGYASAKIEPLYPKQIENSFVRAVEDNRSEAACQISIRCSQPGADGQMKVSLEYTGDVLLASYLINQAQEIIEEEAEVLDHQI
jgi:hypothetical protein